MTGTLQKTRGRRLSFRRTAGRRLAAAFCAVMLLLGLACFAGFSAAGEDHVCSGADCPVCARIGQARSVLEGFLPAASGPAVCLSASAAVCIFLLIFEMPHRTPVGSKVRMND